jgi:hypothetical protein
MLVTFMYLFICSLFNNALSVTQDYIYHRMKGEWQIVKDVKQSSCGLF